MKKLFLYLILAVTFTACNNNAPIEEIVEVNEEIPANALTVDNLLDNIENIVGESIVVIGHVDHVCKHGGTKMVIYTDNPENGLHINATEESGNFRADEVMNEMVMVNGIVDEFVVDEGYIVEKEAKLAEMMAEEGESTVATEENAEGDHKGNFPDRDEKHKQEISGLQNQISSLREQLDTARANGKDHLSFYSVKCSSYEVIEREDKEEGKTQSEVKEAQGHVESAVENEATENKPE